MTDERRPGPGDEDVDHDAENPQANDPFTDAEEEGWPVSDEE
ncbi:hypothetical protein [Microbacterium indicum]|nr:hypothetical protein [Microbacterium indicum]